MLTTDRAARGALGLVAPVVLWESRKLPLGTLHNPGPSYMPVALAAILLVFGVLLGVVGGTAGRLASVGWSEWRHAVAIFAVCAFGALALERLGCRATMAVALGFLLGVVERKRILLPLAFSPAVPPRTFRLFDTLLRVPLPRGPLGF